MSLALTAAGIPCEIRPGKVVKGAGANPPEAEVWIRRNQDLHHAFMVCIQQSIGFAKRATFFEEIETDETAVAA